MLARARDDKGGDRRAFAKVRKAETQFARQLRKVAHHVGTIIKGFPPGDPAALPALKRSLEKYADVIEPWAKATAGRMIAEVDRRDEKAWEETSKTMGVALRREIETAPTGQILRDYLGEQVKLIKSLPIEAAQRVYDLTIEGIENSTRASEIAKEIMRSGEVTVSRANLIARTEVARTASGLVQARAQHVGSVGYIWRTAGDGDVRPSHRAMNGKFVSWDDPPTLDNMKGQAGMFPNCRCYPEPVIPDDV